MPLDLQPPTGVDTARPGPFPHGNDDPGIRVPHPRWAVLETHPQSEHWAEQNLRQRGYHPFVPRTLAVLRDATVPSLTRAVLRPLFAGYIFVPHDTRDPWRPIRYCPGIRANLLGGKTIHYALDADISLLQASEHMRATQPPESSCWAPGVPCSLRKGYAMAGLPSVILGTNNNHARIAIMFLGQLRHVTAPLSALTHPGDL